MRQNLPTISKISYPEKGFTLIEVLVVATIISILAVIGMVSYTAAGRGGRDAKRKADLESIRSALEIYKADNGCYPPPVSNSYGLDTTLLTPTYINPYPLDPQSPASNYYFYVQLTTQTCNNGSTAAGSYILCSYLENGGTADAQCVLNNANCSPSGPSSCYYHVANP